jgi:NAD-dependent dihydropyrimidine dehydrogenase PreA subunit
MPTSQIPRQKIPWFPTVDYDLCTGEQECLNFCKNDVYEWEEENNRPVVKNPYNCVVGCQACINICPVQAIRFPDKQELRATLRRLREEGAAAAPRGTTGVANNA